MTINVYATGLCHCSVCVPSDMTKEEVENAVNSRYPTGVSSPWKVSEENFKTGEENGFINICDGKETRHWLMVC